VISAAKRNFHARAYGPKLVEIRQVPFEILEGIGVIVNPAVFCGVMHNV
jgi:hypothetical protein